MRSAPPAGAPLRRTACGAVRCARGAVRCARRAGRSAPLRARSVPRRARSVRITPSYLCWGGARRGTVRRAPRGMR